MPKTDIVARQEPGSTFHRASDCATASRPNLWRFALLFPLYLVFALVLQNATGIYHSELSHWPDEAAHATTSLLLHDYVAQGFPANPLAFAKNYYTHYPKVAIGMWPPFFYMVAGTWLLCFGATKVSLLVLEAVIVALLATLMAAFARSFSSLLGSIAAGFLFIALPCTQNLTSMCMVDVPVTLMQFGAMWLLVRFFHTGKTLDAALFGFVAALAMLTKANAISLTLLPVALLILTRRYDLLRRPGLYVGAVIAAMLGLPWQIVSLRMQQTSGSVEHVDANYILHSLAFYSRRFYIEVGPALLALAIVAVFWTLIQFRLRTREASLEVAGAVSLIVACFAFHSFLPTLPDERYLLSAIPSVILCALAGLDLLARALHRWIPRIPTAAAAAVLGAGAVAACPFSIPARPEMGFARVADYIDRHQPHGSVMLVCSDAEGEGAMVVEMALREKRPDRYVLRGTKMLSDNIWQTSHYKALLANPAEASAFLDRAGVGVVVMDRTKVIWEQDRNLLDRALASQPASWQQVSDFSTTGAARDIILYRHTGAPRAPTGSIVIPLRTTLGFDLEVSPMRNTDRK